MKTKIYIIKERNSDDFRKEVNEYISNIDLVDIKFSYVKERGLSVYVAMIIYKVKKDEVDEEDYFEPWLF